MNLAWSWSSKVISNIDCVCLCVCDSSDWLIYKLMRNYTSFSYFPLDPSPDLLISTHSWIGFIKSHDKHFFFFANWNIFNSCKHMFASTATAQSEFMSFRVLLCLTICFLCYLLLLNLVLHSVWTHFSHKSVKLLLFLKLDLSQDDLHHRTYFCW